MRAAGVALIGPIVLYLAAQHLALAPAPWYDEGVNLQAARTLANTGVYGLVYDGGAPRPFDVQLTTGPTVIVPIALVFKVTGVTHTRGRLVMLAYTLLACAGLYLAARMLYGPATALAGLLVLSASDLASPATTRDVVGEVAALAYLFWGIAVLALARARDSSAWHAAAGMCLGMAVLTKGQFALLAPCIVVAWVLSQRTTTAWRLRHTAITLLGLGVPIAAWQAFQVASLGLDGFGEHLREQSAAVAVSAGVPILSQTATNLATLFESKLAVPGLIALVYAAARARSVERSVLVTFAALWLIWFLALSVGYARYTVPLLAVLSLCVAVLAIDVVSAVRARGARLVVGGALAAPVTVGVGANLIAVSRPPPPFAQQFAETIVREVEPEAIIESLEWELDVMSERQFNHPPPFVPLVPYEVPTTSRYLVDGMASKSTRLYVDRLTPQAYEKVTSVGPYDLYRKRQ